MGEPNILSDHQLISFSLAMCADNDTQAPEFHMYYQYGYRYGWNPEKSERFVKKLSSLESVQAFESMKSKFEESIIM